ncbi:hypothetical protein U1Q18_012185 [Sarracenia purpurea var. burkii]
MEPRLKSRESPAYLDWRCLIEEQRAARFASSHSVPIAIALFLQKWMIKFYFLRGQNVVPNKEVLSEKPGESCRKGMFVKINMDGVPIGRKVDLKTYDSYEKLSSVVDGIFRDLLAGYLLSTSNYHTHLGGGLCSGFLHV